MLKDLEAVELYVAKFLFLCCLQKAKPKVPKEDDSNEEVINLESKAKQKENNTNLEDNSSSGNTKKCSKSLTVSSKVTNNQKCSVKRESQSNKQVYISSQTKGKNTKTESGYSVSSHTKQNEVKNEAKEVDNNQSGKNVCNMPSSGGKKGKTKNRRPRACASKVTYNEEGTRSDGLSSAEEGEDNDNEGQKQEARKAGPGKQVKRTAGGKSNGSKGKSHKKYQKRTVDIRRVSFS